MAHADRLHESPAMPSLLNSSPLSPLAAVQRGHQRPAGAGEPEAGGTLDCRTSTAITLAFLHRLSPVTALARHLPIHPPLHSLAQVHETKEAGVYVAGLREDIVSSADQVW